MTVSMRRLYAIGAGYATAHVRRLTPELSRTAARHGGVVHVTALSRAAKRSRLERIVSPCHVQRAWDDCQERDKEWPDYTY